MKRWLEAISLVGFGGMLLGVSIFSAIGPKFVLAQSSTSSEGAMEKETPGDQGEQEVDLAGEEVDYYLPYPGILPDHPLYWLKMVRDRISLWLTRQPGKKVEKLLLYADKRIGAARVLWEGNQIDLAVTTATKAEKYMEQVVGELERFSGEVKNGAALVERVERALAKHEEVLMGMLEKADDASAKILRESVKVLENGRERLKVVKERWGLGGGKEEEELTDEDEAEEAMEASEGGREQPVELQGIL